MRSTTLSRLVPLVVSGLSATALAGPVAASPSPTDAPSSVAAQSLPVSCPRGKGVTVVVDFGPSTTVKCATGDPSSGLAALSGAGFKVVQVQRFPGAVCRINGVPSRTQEACVVMPPSTRYWSYWHAVRGGRWVYSTSGAGTNNPKPGTVEGWAFGAGKPPSTPVPR
ncbi:MAG: hypothetical protein V9G19_25720 [Tetrasphaera sp.]